MMYDRLIKWCINFLTFYMKPYKLEEVEGDLYELLEIRTLKYGKKRASIRMVWDVVRFSRFRYMKGLDDFQGLNSISMLKNYFKISIRSLLRHKFFSAINIAGLSIGISCCFMIMLYIQHEFSYDQFIPEHEKIMRLSLNGYGATPAPFASEAKKEYPEIEQVTRIYETGSATFDLKDKVFLQENGLAADSTFFEVFGIELLDGNTKTALVEPSSIVLTKSMVLKFFKMQNVIGEILRIDGENRKVTGIVDDLPDNSHIAFDYIIPLPNEKWVTNGYWTGNNFMTYFKLKDRSQRKGLEDKLPLFVEKHIGPEIISFTGHASYAEYLEDENSRGYTFFLYPIVDLHLNHKWMSITQDADIDNLYIFSIIAFFVLIIACINFMNLSTARAGTRSKEIGVRKVLGSLKGQLRGQFMAESLVISGVSIILAVILTLGLLPYFNELSGKSFGLSDVVNLQNISILIILGIFTGLLSGIYPAIYMSAIKPIVALKGVMKTSGSALLRKGLVSFQFAISILLIICTVIVYGQVEFMTSQKLGINTDHTLVIENAEKLGKNLTVFKSETLNQPQVEGIAISNTYPSSFVPDWTYTSEGESSKSISPDHLFVSPEYQDLLKIEMVTGDFFSGLATDTAKIIVNEALLRSLDWKLEDAVGKVLKRAESEKYRIAGVIKDFQFSSFRRNLRPMLMRYSPYLETGEMNACMLIKLNGNYQNVVQDIENKWKNLAGREVLEYSFLDQEFNRLYDTERKFGKIFTTFSVLAILIACLGLFALSAFMLEQRLKEVAVRKVLGANVLQIISIFIGAFIKFILIGAVVAIPLGYFLADQWLADYKIQLFLNPLFFIVPVLIVAVIAFLTVTIQILKSGNVNPAIILKSE